MDSIVERVFESLPYGRIASWPSVAKGVMRYVASAPPGNHLEIGILHGGTLIMAALIREARGLGGETIGVDPLKGYYPPYNLLPKGHKPPNVSWTDTEISLDTVTQNLRAFGVENSVKIIREFSYPWPWILHYRNFSSVYIDGDHYNDAPLIDWVNVSRQVVRGGIVVFDDCNDNCPGVQHACDIAEKTPGWEKIAHIENHAFVLRRVL